MPQSNADANVKKVPTPTTAPMTTRTRLLALPWQSARALAILIGTLWPLVALPSPPASRRAKQTACTANRPRNWPPIERRRVASSSATYNPDQAVAKGPLVAPVWRSAGRDNCRRCCLCRCCPCCWSAVGQERFACASAADKERPPCLRRPFSAAAKQIPEREREKERQCGPN